MKTEDTITFPTDLTAHKKMVLTDMSLTSVHIHYSHMSEQESFLPA